MPGIDRQSVVGKTEDELDELTCSICQDIFDDPVVTQCCRQTYCKFCINEWLIANNTCPNDRKPLSSNQLIPAPRIVVNLLNKLSIKCENHGNGCQTVLSIEEMANHILICDYYSCNSCKTSKILLSEKHKEIDSLRNQLKANEKDMKDMEERMQTMNFTLNKCEKDLIILSRTNSRFQVVADIGLTNELRNYIINMINLGLGTKNSFGEVASFIKENLNIHHLLKEFNWTIIIGPEFNALIGGKIRLCIKYNVGFKVIINGYEQN